MLITQPFPSRTFYSFWCPELHLTPVWAASLSCYSKVESTHEKSLAYKFLLKIWSPVDEAFFSYTPNQCLLLFIIDAAILNKCCYGTWPMTEVNRPDLDAKHYNSQLHISIIFKWDCLMQGFICSLKLTFQIQSASGNSW